MNKETLRSAFSDFLFKQSSEFVKIFNQRVLDIFIQEQDKVFLKYFHILFTMLDLTDVCGQFASEKAEYLKSDTILNYN